MNIIKNGTQPSIKGNEDWFTGNRFILSNAFSFAT